MNETIRARTGSSFGFLIARDRFIKVYVNLSVNTASLCVLADSSDSHEFSRLVYQPTRVIEVFVKKG